MKKNFWLKQLPLVLLAGGLVFSAAAWQDHSARQTRPTSDTTPTKRHLKITNVDQALEELERGEQELNRNLKELDMGAIEKDMREALKNMKVDLSKMQLEVDKAAQQIDFDQIRQSLDLSLGQLSKLKDLDHLKGVDVSAMQAEVNRAIKEVNIEKIKADVQKSISQFELRKMSEEIERLQQVEMVRLEAEVKRLKPEIEQSLSEVSKELKKARAELKEFKEFIDGLDKDGLLEKDQPYTIEHAEGVLTINGKTQSKEVYRKYSTFLKKYRKFTLGKDEDNLNMNRE